MLIFGASLFRHINTNLAIEESRVMSLAFSVALVAYTLYDQYMRSNFYAHSTVKLVYEMTVAIFLMETIFAIMIYS